MNKNRESSIHLRKGGNPTTKNSWAELREEVGTDKAGKVNGLVLDDLVPQIKVLEPHPMVGETLRKEEF